MVDETLPSVWTVYGTASKGPTKFTSIRLSLGTRAAAQIDELRVSDSWDAAVNIAKTQGQAKAPHWVHRRLFSNRSMALRGRA